MRPIVILLPADDDELRDEVISQLEPYAYVSEPPPSMLGVEEIKLIIEIIAGATGIMTNVVGVATFLLLLKKDREQRRKEQLTDEIKIARLGESPVSLREVDEASLRRLLGAPESD